MCLLFSASPVLAATTPWIGDAHAAARMMTAVRGDWTRPSPVITAYLERFDCYGVSLDVVYGPGAPEGIVLPSLLTPSVAMNTLRRAGEKRGK